MVGKIHAKREAHKTPGKKFGTTTYKKGGAVKKAKGGKITKKMGGGMMPQKPMMGSNPNMTGSNPNMPAYKKGGKKK